MLRKLVSTASADRKNVLVRSLVAILYAHWEGFLKSTAESYIRYVRLQRLPFSDLADNFLAYALRPRVRAAVERKDPGELIEVVRFLRGGMIEPSKITKRAVDAESNLSSRVLRNLTTALGLDYRPFESKAFLIDERLLKNRNRIAHGDYLALDAADALALTTNIISLMESFRNQVENAAVLSRYKHPA